MKPFEGLWIYRSFYSTGISLKNSPITGTELTGAERLAYPWAPPAEISATLAADSSITGTIAVMGSPLTGKVSGTSIPAYKDDANPRASRPPYVDLTVEVLRPGETLPSIYKIRGVQLQDTDVIVGTVIVLQNDLAGQPLGTSGPFILTPKV